MSSISQRALGLMRFRQHNHNAGKKPSQLSSHKGNMKLKAEARTHLKRLRLKAQRLPQNCNHFATMLVVEEQGKITEGILNRKQTKFVPDVPEPESTLVESPHTRTHSSSTPARTETATLPVKSQQGKQLTAHGQPLSASCCLFSPSLDGYGALPPSFIAGYLLLSQKAEI